MTKMPAGRPRPVSGAPGGEEWLLGIDIGTSSVKALAINPAGRLLASASCEHPMHHPRPGWAENDPEDWVKGVKAVVADLRATPGVQPSGVVGLCVVSQRDPWVLLDQRRRPLAPSISWTDRRTEPDLAAFCRRLGRSWLIDRTGVLPIPGLGLPTLLWTQRNQPELWRSVRHLMSPKDYVLWRLIGFTESDISMPARSVMNDVRQAAWCPEICDAAGIEADWLPGLSWRPWERIGELSQRGAELLGLPPGVPIAAGGGDDPSATLGAGATRDGDLCAGTGTSSDWRLVTSECRPDSDLARGDLAQHLTPGQFIFEVCIESTGSSMRWFRDAFSNSHNDYLAMIQQAEAVAPGADGLIFLPFVDGSNRAPWFMEGATGSFLGIVSGHTREHFIRAILEGIAFQYPATLNLIAPDRDPSQPITLVDGEARSSVWNQLKADIMGVPIATTHISESAALGAAILAGQAAGQFRDADEGVRQLVHFSRIYEPNPQKTAIYDELRVAHKRVLDAVSTTYRSHSEEDSP